MSKLKRVNKDSYMMNCRWCHYFRSGKCWNEDILELDDLAVYEVAESGHLEELLKEEIGNACTDAFKEELASKLSEWGISNKRIKEFDSLFDKCFNKFSQQLIPNVGEQVSILYQESLDKSTFEGFEIADPEEFVCKDWC